MNGRIPTSKALILLVIAAALFSHHTYQEGTVPDLSMELVGYLLLIIAAMGRTWCAAFISGRKNATLVTEGPYSISRNPLYLFSLVGFVGAGLAFESIVIAVAMGAVFFITHWSAILSEEVRLRSLFPDEFGRYVNRVPRLFPHSLRVRYPEHVTINPSVFTRALAECSLILLVFGLASSVEWAHLHGKLPVLFYLP